MVFKATWSKRESRFWARWARKPKQCEDHGARGERFDEREQERERAREKERERVGAAALSGFTLQWSRTIPPSAPSTKPPSAFHPSFNPAGVLVLLRHRLSVAIRVLVTRRHRSSIFLFDRFFPPARGAARRPRAGAPAVLHYACATSRA